MQDKVDLVIVLAIIITVIVVYLINKFTKDSTDPYVGFNGEESKMHNDISEYSKKETKVFLGGTCNDSKWREELIAMLEIPYFNPVVEDWNDEAYEEELKQREICTELLYVITPKMTGVYSIAEVIDDSNKRPESTIFVCLTEDGDSEPFTEGQLKSLMAVRDMVIKNEGLVFDNLVSVAAYLNGKKKLSV